MSLREPCERSFRGTAECLERYARRGAEPYEGAVSAAAFFEGVDVDDLRCAACCASARRYFAGEVVFRQDEEADGVFLLTDGRVKIVQVTPEGRQIILRFVEPGEIFGFVAVVPGARYPATAEAAVESRCLAWTGAALRTLMRDAPAVAMSAVRHMSAQVAELQERIRELSVERVEQRIAGTLVRLAERAGRLAGTEGRRLCGEQLGGKRSQEPISIRLTRQEIGEMTGTSLYTVSRVMSRWDAQGATASRRGRIIIRDLDALAAIADRKRGEERQHSRGERMDPI